MKAAWSGPSASHRLSAYFVLSAVCVVFSLVAGKDLNWDLLNYHYYLGFSAFHNRFAQDFFPASFLSYATPYAYAPFYLLVSAGLDDRLISAVLAILGSTALWAVWEIGGLLGAASSSTRRFSVVQAYLGAALAAICPIYFLQVGTTYIDITTAAVALFGYVFLVRFALGRSRGALVLAAILLGIAVALKQTNVIYALAGVFLVVAAGSPRIRNLAIYSTSGLLAGAAVLAPWTIALYRAFGNPFFPQFNSVFKSPDFDVAAPLSRHYRFIPDSWSDAILRPIWMMSPEKGVYTEPPAPDARYFFLAALVLISCLSWVLRKRDDQQSMGDAALPGSASVIWGAIGAFLASWCLWLGVSGNGRYFMPMALFAGPLLVACVHFIGGNRRWVAYSLGLVFAVSMSLVVMASAVRHHPSPWSGRYLDVEVPASMLEHESVVISLSTQPAAFVVPFLHPRTSFINLAGMHVLDPDRPGWGRVERLLGGTSSPKFLFPAKVDESGEMVPPDRGHLDSLTGRIGYRVDNSRCEAIVVRGLTSTWPGMSSSSDGEPQFNITQSQNTLYAVCPGHADDALRLQYLTQSASVNPLFEAVERRCPKLFPRGAVTQGLGDQWSRTYNATDSLLFYYNKKLRYDGFGKRRQLVIGTAAEIESGRFDIECTRKRDPLLSIGEVLG